MLSSTPQSFKAYRHQRLLLEEGALDRERLKFLVACVARVARETLKLVSVRASRRCGIALSRPASSRLAPY
jgi:hypothetical protein